MKYIVVVDLKGWSLPAGGAWVEIQEHGFDLSAIMSLPARGAWVEIVRC